MKKHLGTKSERILMDSLGNGLFKSQVCADTRSILRFRGILAIIASLITIVSVVSPAVAQNTSSLSSDHIAAGVTITGTVLDSSGKAIGNASVRLNLKGASNILKTSTNALGVFEFSSLSPGIYTVTAENPGLRSRSTVVSALSRGDQTAVNLILEPFENDPKIAQTDSVSVMEFADKPNFTVAGVTDWTAVGGHGSDSSLRTSEALTRETLTLKPEIEKHPVVDSPADVHRFEGEQDEKRGDPLAAVHEFEQAVRLDPNEQNYFEWGSELLLHRAVWQAQEVFARGAEAYPKSARMLTALGTALFASARYDEAALRLCTASDLNPANAEPYIFMGKVEMAAPNPLACIENKLARFVQQQPENALANYFYAMALWKRHQQLSNAQTLQQVEALLTKAVTVDAKCSDAYLQLGIIKASQHNFDQAISFYIKAIEGNPQLGDAHYRLAVAYDRVGEHLKAKQQFELHDEIEKQDAAQTESQRREVKQFLVVLQGQTSVSPTH